MLSLASATAGSLPGWGHAGKGLYAAVNAPSDGLFLLVIIIVSASGAVVVGVEGRVAVVVGVEGRVAGDGWQRRQAAQGGGEVASEVHRWI